MNAAISWSNKIKRAYIYSETIWLIFQMFVDSQIQYKGYVCDWLWENLPLMHKDKYLETSNSIIHSVISREGSKLHAYNSLQICSYLIAIRLPTAQSTAS